MAISSQWPSTFLRFFLLAISSQRLAVAGETITRTRTGVVAFKSESRFVVSRRSSEVCEDGCDEFICGLQLLFQLLNAVAAANARREILRSYLTVGDFPAGAAHAQGPF